MEENGIYPFLLVMKILTR